MGFWETTAEFFGKKERQIEPQNYKVGVSTGPPSIAKQVGVVPATVAKVTGSSIFKGGDVIQVDVDLPTTITPHDIVELQNIKRAHGVIFGMHASVMYPFDIDSPKKRDYLIVDKDLVDYIRVAGKIGIKFIVIHTAYNISPTYYKDLTDFYAGYPLSLYVGPEGKPFKDSLKGMAFDWYSNNIIRKKLSEKNIEEIVGKEMGRRFGGNVQKVQDYIQKLGEQGWAAEQKKILKQYIKDNIDYIGSVHEYDVFKIIAWNMYEDKDYLWQTIALGKRPDVLETEGNEMLIANAVVAKYVQSHVKKVMRLLERYNIMIVFETPDLRSPEARGLFPMVRPRDNYYLIKGINHKLVKMAVDFEHLASHGYDLEREISTSPGDMGRYVKVMHLGSYPSPTHIHAAIEKGDVYLYRLLWLMRKKGMKDAYLIFERGGGKEEEVWKQSTTNLKDIAMYLEAKISPEKLPPEFYGFNKEDIEHDRRIMEEHTFDPLQGLLESPQLQHTWLGREAISKKGMKPEEWAKEEYR